MAKPSLGEDNSMNDVTNEADVLNNAFRSQAISNERKNIADSLVQIMVKLNELSATVDSMKELHEPKKTTRAKPKVVEGS